MSRTALGAVKRKGACVSAAVNHVLALGNGGCGTSVIFLVKEKAGFLTVFHVNIVLYAVFGNDGDGGYIVLSEIPALFLCHALKGAYIYVISQIDAVNFAAVISENIQQSGENDISALFNAQ